MNPTIWYRLDEAVRYAAPAAVLLFIVMLSVIPLGAASYGPVAPMLALPALFHWAVHRPGMLPSSVVFATGLLQDVLTAAPIGLNAFLFLAFFTIVAGQRRHLLGRPFIVLWCGFLVVLIPTVLIEWLGYSVLFGNVMPIGPVAFRVLITAAIFPVLAWLLIQVQRGLLPQTGTR